MTQACFQWRETIIHFLTYKYSFPKLLSTAILLYIWGIIAFVLHTELAINKKRNLNIYQRQYNSFITYTKPRFVSYQLCIQPSIFSPRICNSLPLVMLSIFERLQISSSIFHRLRLADKRYPLAADVAGALLCRYHGDWEAQQQAATSKGRYRYIHGAVPLWALHRSQ